MKRTFLLLVTVALLSLNLFADTVTINTGTSISSTDLFEGKTVGSSANLLAGIDSRDLLGGSYGSVEPGSVIASDDTLMASIAFQTKTDFSVKQFTVSLGEDDNGTGDRAASKIIFSYSQDLEVWTEAFSQTLSSDYETTYGDHNIHVVATMDQAISSKYWKIEWESFSAGEGARLFEVDASAVPEPATASMMALVGGLGFLIRRHLVS